MKFIDDFLNSITMYRLVLYYLIALVGIAGAYSILGILHFNFFWYAISVFVLVAVGWVTNTIFASVFEAPTNLESVYISALILALIISPATSLSGVIFLAWAAVLTMASKYIIAFKKKHFLNPVALAVFLTSLVLGQSANWWVGTLSMLPWVVIGGILVVRKLQREDMVYSFLITALITILATSVIKGSDIILIAQRAIVESPLMFFAFVMFTEPLTSPPTKRLQIYYGILTGILFSPQISFLGFYTTPETALLAGNVFSYLVSPKDKLALKLKEKVQLGPDIYDFVFELEKKLNYTPGQYMEWTLGHENPDSRGSRRYFTLASSPTENEIRIGVKFYENSSSYKKALFAMKTGSMIVASQLAGDFTLPDDPKKKYVFIAGGIGITPFRSMLKFLLDTGKNLPVTIFYSNKNFSDISYREVFDQAQKELGIKTVYNLTDTASIPVGWPGKVGRINDQMIRDEVPDFAERTFYLSGPRSMVDRFEETLSGMGIPKHQIKTDFFPGFA